MEDIVKVMENYIYNNECANLETFKNCYYEIVKTYIAMYENIEEAKHNLQNEFRTACDNAGLDIEVGYDLEVNLTTVYQESKIPPSIFVKGLSALRSMFKGGSS